MTVKQSLLFHRFVKTFQNAENIKETITEKISVTLIELRCVSCVCQIPLCCDLRMSRDLYQLSLTPPMVISASLAETSRCKTSAVFMSEIFNCWTIEFIKMSYFAAEYQICETCEYFT